MRKYKIYIDKAVYVNIRLKFFFYVSMFSYVGFFLFFWQDFCMASKEIIADLVAFS